MLISLRNRLALVFFGITLVAIAALYLYLVPGLGGRLVDARIHELAAAGQRYSRAIAATVGSNASRLQVIAAVDRASAASGTRVTLLSVSESVAPPGPQLAVAADSAKAHATAGLHYDVAWRAIHTGRVATGTRGVSSGGGIAEAAVPVSFGGRVVRVIVYSTPIADIAHSVDVVRHQILVAGGIALLLALIGGYLIARWLSARVKRLERAAERVAAGEFGHPIRVDSRDELGQLAVAFNDMQRQLALLERARKQFIATASHELRTPVFSLGGFVELLEDEDLDPDTRRRFLGHIAEQVERLRKLSVDLLDLSRLESGSLELRPEPVELTELTRSVAGEFEVSLTQHDAHLELRLAPDAEAHCDPVRLAQILRILIDNALTHTSSGTHITLAAMRSGGHVRVAVRDDGGGIEPAALSRIFEPFFTADDAQGSGLGLAIASELAERMNGQLSVHPVPGGTEFTLELPAARAASSPVV